MFRAYNMDTRQQVGKNEDELKIVDAIGYDISNSTTERLNYIVIDDSKGYDDTIKTINNRNEYIIYLNEVKDKIKTLTKHL